jgi:hypothetical protein
MFYKSIIAAIVLSTSITATASDVTLVVYPQAEGVQVVYNWAYVGYSNKGVTDHNVTVKTCDYTSKCVSDKTDWFDRSYQVGFIVPTDSVKPFAGLTYAKEYSKDVFIKDNKYVKTVNNSSNSVEFEAGAMYEFYPHVVAAIKYTTLYEEVQFGLGYKF